MNSIYPTFNIVTPSYNQGKYLETTIKSVISQDGDFYIDYVIMDGGSTDNTLDIIGTYDELLQSRQFPVKCKGVSLYWQSAKDAGQYDAINRGFSMYTGQFMGWINSDDIYLPGAFNTIAMVFQRFPEVKWVTAHSTRIDSEGRITDVETTALYPRDLVARGVYNGRIAPFIQQESTIWRRSLWDQLEDKLGATYKYAADYELWKKFAALTELVKIRTQIGAFRSHSGQKTNNISRYYEEVDSMGNISILDRISMKISKAFSRVYPLDRGSLMHRSALTVYYSHRESEWLIKRVRGRVS